MTLREKLEKLKQIQEQKTDPNWEKYKETWKNAVEELLHLVIDKWLDEYREAGLMEFALIPIKRNDPYIGEYATFLLEITLTSNKYIVLEPVTAITAEYDGKLEFYMMGNVSKKATIIRKIIDEKSYSWLLADAEHKDFQPLGKSIIEKLINQWLQ